MLSHMIKAVTGVSLLLAVPFSAPALSAAKTAVHEPGKCTSAKHRHAKRVIVAKAARGAMLVEHRKDVQILSFGP